MTRFIKCSLRYCLAVMNSLWVNEEKWMWIHTESLSAFTLLCCQLSGTVKDLAKWSIWRASLLKPHILEIKFIKRVRSPAYSLGWLSGLKFEQLAGDFKCQEDLYQLWFLRFSNLASLSRGKYSELMVVSVCYFDPFLLQKAKSF